MSEGDADEESDGDWLQRGVEDGDVSVDLDDPPRDTTARADDPDATADAGVGASETPADASADTESEDDDDDAALFEQDFAAALGDADPGIGGETSASDGEFGAGPEGPGGVGAGDPPTDLDADFPGGEFGDEGFGGGFGGETEFEEADFETDIDRIDLGIDGLDEMIQGGVPRRSLMVAIGSAGTGKTTFGIQFLDQALADGGSAVYITLEESRDRIINSASEKGYPFDEYVDDGRLAIVDFDPIEMANSLATIRSELPRLVSEFDADRLVLDSVSLLEMMYDDRAKRRNEIYDFTQSLKRAGVTTMMTSEASSDSAYTSRHGIVEYLTDAVFILQYVRPSDFRKTRLAIEIQKIRDANHSRETKPYEITNEGISVYRQANIF